MDPLAILAAMLHVQARMNIPLHECVETAATILELAESEAALHRGLVEAEEKAVQAVPITNKVM